MSKIIIPENLKGDELHKFLKANKEILVAQKKFEVKRGDAIQYSNYLINDKGEAVKANAGTATPSDPNVIQVLSVINTTNLMDSHSDVHIPGLWKKSLQEQKSFYLLQEHEMSFENIISDEVQASTKQMTWKALGWDMEGSTQALIFDSTVRMKRNPYMFDQYSSGYVKNHSVGMRYVTLFLCINSDEKYLREEKEYWDKYIEQVANRDAAEEQGYFWAVTEAKIVEGSAVPIGSNTITPTLSVEQKNISTEDQPTEVTEDQPDKLDISSLLKCFN